MFENRGVKTLLLDLDPQFNLTQGLFRRDLYDQFKSQAKTIFSVMEPSSDDTALSSLTVILVAPS